MLDRYSGASLVDALRRVQDSVHCRWQHCGVTLLNVYNIDRYTMYNIRGNTAEVGNFLEDNPRGQFKNK